MAHSTWKDTERRNARRAGSERTGARGEAIYDFRKAWLSVEVKHRKTVAGWIKDFVSQAVTNAAPGTLPVVVLHEHRKHDRNNLVIMRQGDFEDWFGWDAEHIDRIKEACECPDKIG